MTAAHHPDAREQTDAPTRDDACTAAPQASIGTSVGSDPSGPVAPQPPHGESIRSEVNGSEDSEDAEAIVYDDRTDDRPRP